MNPPDPFDPIENPTFYGEHNGEFVIWRGTDRGPVPVVRLSRDDIPPLLVPLVEFLKG